MQETSNKGLLFGTVGIAILIFAGLAWAILSAPSDSGSIGGTTPAELTDTDSPFVGPPLAGVTVHLFSDLQCPACRSAEPAVRYAMEKYKDRVKFVWKDFPLMSIHPNARSAANAARCAEEFGKFWEYKDILFSSQDSWKSGNPKDSFIAYAKQLNLDEESFTKCYDDRRYDGKVMSAVAEGNRNGVNSTPTVFINGQKYNGLSQTEWDTLLTAALAQ
ncbi:thioredoxin domain-containing protein [Candidatus Uhrbacteria bacterium]|nr:thioredoxin domain-containing protein [Candidatus Uhrbacteria bacterium]